MGRYCTVSEVKTRFRRVEDVTSYPDAVDSAYIVFAENELDGRLASYFTVPFSSNNLTAKDLSVDMTYAKIIQYDDPEKYEAIMGHVDKVIGDLILGDTHMVVDDGTLLYSSNIDDAWSNTEDYHSAFGMGDFLDFAVSSEQIDDEREAR